MASNRREKKSYMMYNPSMKICDGLKVKQAIYKEKENDTPPHKGLPHSDIQFQNFSLNFILRF